MAKTFTVCRVNADMVNDVFNSRYLQIIMATLFLRVLVLRNLSVNTLLLFWLNWHACQVVPIRHSNHPWRCIRSRHNSSMYYWNVHLTLPGDTLHKGSLSHWKYGKTKIPSGWSRFGRSKHLYLFLCAGKQLTHSSGLFTHCKTSPSDAVSV